MGYFVAQPHLIPTTAPWGGNEDEPHLQREARGPGEVKRLSKCPNEIKCALPAPDVHQPLPDLSLPLAAPHCPSLPLAAPLGPSGCDEALSQVLAQGGRSQNGNLFC